MATEEEFAKLRQQMVQEQLLNRDIRDKRVLDAMSRVPRHLHVPSQYQYLAYDDMPIPIGREQTISQPYVVAFMTQALSLSQEDRVLEVGTGSGYQTAVLAELVDQVYSVELDCQFAQSARQLLAMEGYNKITTKCGDGYEGWQEYAPFNAILVTAAPPMIPNLLLEQLAEGGRMVIPVGDLDQTLKLIRKGKDGALSQVDLLPVRFVPMVHPDQKTR